MSGIGGSQRPGQVAMAEPCSRPWSRASTWRCRRGPGPASRWPIWFRPSGTPSARAATVIISTATIALQRQLIERDLPRLSAGLAELLGREPVFAILKGRRNYLCLHKVHGGPDEEPDDALFDPRSVSATGRQVQRLHEWAASTETGDRDELIPGVDERSWRHVSVSARECIGAQKCPFGTQCFAELARRGGG